MKVWTPEDPTPIALIVSNGVVRWNYSLLTDAATRYHLAALDEDAKKKGWISAGRLDEARMKYIRTEKIGAEEMYVFETEPSELTKQSNPTHFQRAQIHVGALDGILRKLTLYDHQGKETDSLTYTNIRRDSSISDKDFEFTPPPGTQIHEVSEVPN